VKKLDVEEARRAARKNSRDIRLVGEMPSYDVVVLENRLTGERRRVPNKVRLFANNDLAVAFEMVNPGPGFEEEDQTEEE
jgi:hypothetical protein